MASADEVLSIDESALDKEWQAQPRRVFFAAQKAAEARREVTGLANAVKVAEAEAALEIRKDPAAFGLVRATDDGVKAAVRVHPAVRQAEEQLAEAKYALDMAEGFVDALDHKKRAMENLVQLLAQNYWSPPRVRGAAATDEAKAESAVRRSADIAPARKK